MCLAVLVLAGLTDVADGESERLGGGPAVVSVDLNANLHRSDGEQVAVPAAGESLTVDALVPGQRGGRDLFPVAMHAGS